MTLAERFTFGAGEHVALTLVPCTARERTTDSRNLRHDLLRALHPGDGYRDLRAIHKDKDTKTFSFSTANLAGVDEFAQTYADYNIFFGVATRATPGRDSAACATLHTLFADFDFKDLSEAEVRARVAAFPLVPSAIVASGGGLHCYWFLDAPLDLRNRGDIAAKQLLRALATALAADLKAAEPVHILRLPGTRNYKYTPPRDAVVEALSEQRRYSVADFEAVLPALADDQQTTPPLPSTITEGSRNEVLFKEGCRLRRLGWERSEIVAALQILNRARCQPPLDEREVDGIAGHCAKYEPTVDTLPTTETGDAEFFVSCNADSVRFDHRRGRWLLFDGHIWVPQTSGQLMRLALEAVRARKWPRQGAPATIAPGA